MALGIEGEVFKENHVDVEGNVRSLLSVDESVCNNGSCPIIKVDENGGGEGREVERRGVRWKKRKKKRKKEGSKEARREKKREKRERIQRKRPKIGRCRVSPLIELGRSFPSPSPSSSPALSSHRVYPIPGFYYSVSINWERQFCGIPFF